MYNMSNLVIWRNWCLLNRNALFFFTRYLGTNLYRMLYFTKFHKKKPSGRIHKVFAWKSIAIFNIEMNFNGSM